MDAQRRRILVVDDEKTVTDSLRLILTDAGFEVLTAENVTEAKAIINNIQLDLVVTDYRLPDGNGIDLITHVKSEAPDTEVILMTAHGSVDMTIEAIKRGAYYYLDKPYTPDRLLDLVDRALKLASTETEPPECNDRRFGLIGHDPKLQHIIEAIQTVAASDAAVLIEGESGTGKGLIATAIHAQSQRSAGSFISIDCSAIPPELLESKLFGDHGVIEAANAGTLLLDEIGTLPTQLQMRLVQTLEEHKRDFRLLCTTLSDENRLCKDLYFRISTIKINVPPLRERLDDLPLLAKCFLARFNQQYGKKIRNISADTMLRLLRYDWPGNVRELENVIERAVLFCTGSQLRSDCLPEDLQRKRRNRSTFVIPPFAALEEIEREAIVQTLERTSGNIKRSAQILRCPRPTFYRRLKKLGIKVDRSTHKAVITH
jgi:DNA-binding NtrC family response regulator